jgi:hypothetical protein
LEVLFLKNVLESRYCHHWWSCCYDPQIASTGPPIVFFFGVCILDV